LFPLSESAKRFRSAKVKVTHCIINTVPSLPTGVKFPYGGMHVQRAVNGQASMTDWLHLAEVCMSENNRPMYNAHS